ncbi:MAG TPA: SDR family oxidoreductase [Thermoleophilia bacterium]|nr:SDR family oxidoreductase [Thermoleophilia bacterium]
MSNHTLVTGASGRAGTEMIRQLAAAGASVRGAVHFPDHDAESRVGRVDFVEVDFDQPETLDTAFRGIDKAVLITPEESEMVVQTRNLVRAAERAGVGHLVRVSFLHAGAAGGQLLDWHLEAERVVQESAIPSTILRPNSYMQNFLTMYGPSIFVRGAFFTPMGAGRISYIDARDVADAAVHVLLLAESDSLERADDRVYSLTGPRPLPHDEIAQILTRAAGQPIRYVDIGEEDACVALRRRGASEQLVEALCELWLAMRHDEFATTAGDFEELTGRLPRSFEDFVREHAEELRVSPTART